MHTFLLPLNFSSHQWERKVIGFLLQMTRHRLMLCDILIKKCFLKMFFNCYVALWFELCCIPSEKVLVIGHQLWVVVCCVCFFLLQTFVRLTAHTQCGIFGILFTEHYVKFKTNFEFYYFYSTLQHYSGMSLFEIKQFPFLNMWEIRHVHCLSFRVPHKNRVLKICVLLNILFWRQILYLGKKFFNNCLFFLL